MGRFLDDMEYFCNQACWNFGIPIYCRFVFPMLGIGDGLPENGRLKFQFGISIAIKTIIRVFLRQYLIVFLVRVIPARDGGQFSQFVVYGMCVLFFFQTH